MYDPDDYEQEYCTEMAVVGYLAGFALILAVFAAVLWICC